MDVVPSTYDPFNGFVSSLPAATTPLSSSDKIPVVQGGISKQFPGNSLRNVLTAVANYYVSVIGSDSNPGTQGQPWATLQHAMNVVSNTIDTSGFNVNINIGPGTFAGVGLKPVFGGGAIGFTGAGQASTIITNSPFDPVYSGDTAPFDLDVITNSIFCINMLTAKPSAPCLACIYTNVGNAVFILGVNGDQTGGATPGVNFDGNGQTTLGAIATDGPQLAFFDGNGLFATSFNIQGVTTFLSLDQQTYFAIGSQWTINGSPTVNPGILLKTQSLLVIFGGTPPFAGSATGQRFQVFEGSACFNEARASRLGPNFFPGSTPGSVDAESSYDRTPGPLPPNTQTVSYTLTINDVGQIIEMNLAVANTVTVPTNASVPFEIGTRVKVVQIGAGATTIQGAGGVTVDNAGALAGQWASAFLYKRGTDEWVQTQ